LENALIIRSAENVGLGSALNRLVETARNEGATQILLMDQDSGSHPCIVDLLNRALDRHQAAGRKVAAIGPRLVPPRGENYRRLRYAWRDEGEGTAYFIPTSGSLISVSAWCEIGPFRADFFIDGLDVEWGLRALKKGYDSIVALDVMLEHRWGSPTAECGDNKPQILRYPPQRCFFYIRNNVAMLAEPHIPMIWKAKVVARLSLQIGLLAASSRFHKDLGRLQEAAGSRA
jgi:rhamnosyltransferase